MGSKILSKKVSTKFISYSSKLSNLRILRQKPTDWIGREISPGQIGLINHGGMPKVLTRAGRYPGFPLRNWWARSWEGKMGSESFSFLSSYRFAVANT